jgi:acyl-CoA hydrolase
MPQPEAVLFDVGGTLVDTVDLHARAWVEALEDFGVETTLRICGSRAVRQAKGRVTTALAEAVEFQRPVFVGDEVFRYCSPVKAGEASPTLVVETCASARVCASEPENVTEGTFRFVGIDEHGKPRRVESSPGNNE